MSALRLPDHEPDTTPEAPTSEVAPRDPDIAYMGGTAEDIDRIHPAAFWGAIAAGIGMWGLIIAGMVALFG